MKKLLRNLSTAVIDTIYHGRHYHIGAKATIVLDHDGNDEQAANYLLQTYGFLRDETPKIVPPPLLREVEVKNKKGRIVKRKVHVYKKAIPKGGKHI